MYSLLIIWFYRLLVASQDGFLYVYQFPLDGGECQLIKKHDLRNIDPSPARTGTGNQRNVSYNVLEMIISL